ncbi:MAG: UDP-2,3-diacylglucosamine diphosphatase [Bacteroidia bacterium]|nr:UDP-2,3-diacylglucosamine diphosphatase [Bacteroidia bacterium]MCC7533687.1 UDP-2,3-diacylglucosamine diphosphatase [Bacteroidia bacterium]MCZ2141399.1 UDP-2,3-diacylglucosamine diphosphatase [Bacteroidia bacterium]
MSSSKHIYFASDFHLGVPNHSESIEREKKIIAWLDSISNDASDIYLVGDLFDFWFEFKTVVPKGFVRLLGKLAELSDAGIKIHIFHGNHDLWQFGYLEKEIGCVVYSKPITITIGEKIFHIAHGDGLGPKQFWFKFILGIYRNYFFQRAFAFFHPNIGITIANWFSHRSKKHTFTENATYYGDDKEFLMLYAKSVLKQQHIDYFIFGHRHLPMTKPISNTSNYINLGDWMSYNTYAVFNGNEVVLKTFNQK